QPGFAAISRHPLFLALALWAGAHLFPNGDLAHVILFGSFTLMAVAAVPAFDARARSSLGKEAAGFFARSSVFSPMPLWNAAWLRANARTLAIRSLVGLTLWFGFLHIHAGLFGVSPFPL
ncbi:NnrU family protein, partial [Cribrihabitans sp. XS_ASV171]